MKFRRSEEDFHSFNSRTGKTRETRRKDEKKEVYVQPMHVDA